MNTTERNLTSVDVLITSNQNLLKTYQEKSKKIRHPIEQKEYKRIYDIVWKNEGNQGNLCFESRCYSING